MTGTIRAICPHCGSTIKVEVNFPEWNAGFTAKEHTCQVCGEHLMVTDPHEYNEDGTIK
jgi:rRNA maturation protein Nop10